MQEAHGLSRNVAVMPKHRRDVNAWRDVAVMSYDVGNIGTVSYIFVDVCPPIFFFIVFFIVDRC